MTMAKGDNEFNVVNAVPALLPLAPLTNDCHLHYYGMAITIDANGSIDANGNNCITGTVGFVL